MSLPSCHRQSRLRSLRNSRARLGVLSLEHRDAPAVGLGSAIGVGNDTGSSSAYGVAADAAGNSFMTGNFSGTVDFDPANNHAGDTDILTANGSLDIYVAKYAPDSSLVWVVRMGGNAASPGSDIGQSVDIDGNGNIIVTGSFRGTADFGSINLTSIGTGKDGFVAKLNPTGTVVWANCWGSSNADAYSGESGMGVETDAAGNVYVMGNRFFNGGVLNGGGADYGCDIRKYSSSGTAQWAKYINTRMNAGSVDLAADAAGNVFVSGAFYGTVDFDPNQGKKEISAGSGSYSGFVLKLTSAGNFGWVTPFVGQPQLVNGTWTYGYSHAQRIALGPDGSVVVGGWYGNRVDFNPGSGTTNLPTVGGGFIVKLAGNGGLTWAKAIERDTSSTYSNVFVYGLATDSSGAIYATGSFSGSADFDPGAGVAARTSAGSSDIFAAKYTSAGGFVWAEQFGGTGSDIGQDIAVDPAGTVHIVGSFSGTVDFDPDPLSNADLTASPGRTWGFLLRLTQN